VIVGELMKLSLRIQIAAAVAGVGDEQPPVDGKSHRQSRAHAEHFRVLSRFFEDPGVGLAQRGLELL
jgi:hypothetical protein